MPLWSSNLKHLMKAQGVTRKDIIEKLGVSAPTISDWLSGQIINLKGENLAKLCELFGVTASEFTGQDLSDIGTPSIRRDHGKLPMPSPGMQIRLLPVLFVMNGKGEVLTVIEDERRVFVPSAAGGTKAYAVKLNTDELRPRYKRGEFVLLDPDQTPEPGDEVYIQTAEAEAGIWCMDRLRNGVLQLRHVNETGMPFSIEMDNIKIIHKVIGMAQDVATLTG